MLSDSVKDRIGGAMLGLAIGDALGRPPEGLTPYEVALQYGFVNGFYTPKSGNGGPGSYGMYAQTALVSLMSLADKKDVGRELLSVKEKKLARGWPTSLLAATDKISTGSASHLAGDKELRDGSFLTRALAVGINHSMLKSDDDALKVDVRNVVAITHAKKQALLAGLAIACLARDIIQREDPKINATQLFDSDLSYLAKLTDAVKTLEDGFKQEDRGPDLMWQRLMFTRRCLQSRMDPSSFVGKNGPGKTFQEALSAIIFFFMRTPDDYTTSVCGAVSHGGESALIGSGVAGLIGSYAGTGAFPEDARTALENEQGIIRGWHEMCDLFNETDTKGTEPVGI